MTNFNHVQIARKLTTKLNKPPLYYNHFYLRATKNIVESVTRHLFPKDSDEFYVTLSYENPHISKIWKYLSYYFSNRITD